MIPMRFLVGAAWLCFWAGCCVAGSPSSLTPEQEGWLTKAKRFERAGWIYLHIEGEPRQRGFQHGYLLAREIGEALRVTKTEWEYQSAMEWKWLVTNSATMFVHFDLDADATGQGQEVPFHGS